MVSLNRYCTCVLGGALAGAAAGLVIDAFAAALERRLEGWPGALAAAGAAVGGVLLLTGVRGFLGRVIFAAAWRLLRARLRSNLQAALTALAGLFHA